MITGDLPLQYNCLATKDHIKSQLIIKGKQPLFVKVQIGFDAGLQVPFYLRGLS